MRTALSLLIILCASCAGNDSRQKNAALPLTQTAPPPAGNADASIDLKVTELQTIDGTGEDSFVKDFKYPATYTVNNADTFAGKIGAFGAAYQVWAGPKGWTGRGVVGADGSLAVDLYPPGDRQDAGPTITYTEIAACQGCIASAAAPYFPDAKERYDHEFNDDNANPADTPDGLHINRISPTLVTYTLPVKNGLLTEGVAYYLSPKQDDSYFASAVFTLPENQKPFADFLVNIYIVGRKLN